MVYVPAVVFTSLHKPRASELAMERLRKVWKKYYPKYYSLEIKYGVNITDKFWKEDFSQAKSLIASAEGNVKAGDLTGANYKLVEARQIMQRLRSRNGFEYFLDSMTKFDDNLTQILVSLRGKDRLAEKDLQALRSIYKDLQASWSRVAKTKIDLVAFGFDEEKEKAIRSRIQEEERLIALFAAALASRDADRIFQAAQDLKPNFIVLYKAFGDFQPIFDQIVAERKEREKEEEKEKVEEGSE
ncbi:MAG: hypothetical protein HQ596_02150 [Candidatus Saganbacteria bacterium]|nr:hypothetical protein [Candidatus Saganbacteria bacterium]